MTIDNGNSKLDGGASPAEAKSTLGWLDTLRARLGLQGPPTLRDTIEEALKEEARTSAAFSHEERVMLLRLLRFGALQVADIMVPRADIIAVDESEPVSELLRTFVEAGVSRIPLFHETLDDPRGMIHIKDLLRWLTTEASGPASAEPRNANVPKPVAKPVEVAAAAAFMLGALDLTHCDLSRPVASAKIRRPVLYVPPSMPAMNLLLRMQSTRIHLALVVDEYGGTDGLISIEDLVEQIVGEIEDEHDEAEVAHIYDDPKLGLVALARTPVRELEERLGLKLLTADEEEDIDTLGGLVFAVVGRVPVRGELVRHSSGVEFEVLDADPRRVKKLKVHRPKSGAGSVVDDASGKAA